MSPESLTEQLLHRSQQLGFDLAGVCPAVSPPGIVRFGQWLDAGYAGQMHYLGRRREAYAHPSNVLEGARSVVMLAVNYRSMEPTAIRPGEGRMSRYAWGRDYHDVIHDKLTVLGDFLRSLKPTAKVRGVVDTAPLLEREFAQLAGLGWIGKNTLLLNRHLGSWMFLAALLTDTELAYNTVVETDHCGTCTACLDACPTGAFVQPYVLDARKCISYLTIELKEMIPEPLRSAMGEWVFGCDVCQDVCPWNRQTPQTTEPAFEPEPGTNPANLIELMNMDDAEFHRRFRHTPLWRPRRRGVMRSAAIALGNHPHPDATAALVRCLEDDEPLIRDACVWALGRFHQPHAQAALAAQRTVEHDSSVLAEIDAALRLAEDE
jgi:epoxyqueuosine reductase